MNEPATILLDYYRKCRAECVERYKLAKYWVQRDDARQWCLHYGQLIRKMEAGI